MQFLILTQYFPPEIGAPATRLMAVARELIAAGHKVEILTCMPNYPAGRIHPEYRGCFYRAEKQDGILIHRVWLYASMGTGIRRLLNYTSFALTSLYGLLRVRKPDYMVVESPPLSTVIPCRIAAALWRIPFILNVADLWPDSVEQLGVMRGRIGRMFVRMARRLEANAYKRASFVTAVTAGIFDTLVKDKNVPPQKVLYLPNGVDAELFRVQAPDEQLKRSLDLEGKKVIVYAGTIGYAHGLDVVIEAASRISARADIHFLFIGDGSKRDHFVQAAKDRGLRSLTFLDPVPVSELPKYLSIALCGLVTLRDGIPLLATARPAKALPILACGIPILFCGGLDFPQTIRKERIGLTVAQNSPDELAEAICTLADNAALTADLGRNARRYAVSNGKWSDLVAGWLRHLPSVGEQHGPVRNYQLKIRA